jgi:outer membrane protein TolC
VVRWPLSRTDGEARRHAAEADDGARQARQALTELLGGIELEVRRAWTDDQTARQKVDLAAARADAATEALRIKVLQYDRARATLLDVTQARLEMSRAALDKITARLAVHRAAVAAALATGRS